MKKIQSTQKKRIIKKNQRILQKKKLISMLPPQMMWTSPRSRRLI